MDDRLADGETAVVAEVTDPACRADATNPPAVGTARRSARIAIRALGIATSPLRPRPDILVIGAKRAGTTYITRVLEEHPQVIPLFPSARWTPMRSNKKSPKYFDRHYAKGRWWYRSHFPTALTRSLRSSRVGSRAVTADSGSGYLHHPDAPARIARDVPDARLLVSLRHPIERAYSHWKLNRIDGVEPYEFADALDAEPERMRFAATLRTRDPRRAAILIDRFAYVGHSRYADDLRRLLGLVDRSSVHIVCAEEMFSAPLPTFTAMLEFLALAPIELPSVPAQNASGDEALNAPLRARLTAVLSDPTRELSGIAGRTFPWDGFD